MILLLLLILIVGCGFITFLFRKKLLNNDASEDYEDSEEGDGNSCEDDSEYCCDNEENYEIYEEDDWKNNQKTTLDTFYEKFGTINSFTVRKYLKFIVLGSFSLFLVAGVIWTITENLDYLKKIDSEIPKEKPKPIPVAPSQEEPKHILAPSMPSVPSIPPRDGKFTGPEIFEKYNSAVFVVYASSGISGKQGSGFFVNDSGLAVSNHHVFSGTRSSSIKLTNGQTFNVAKIIAQNEKDDYIIFQVNLGFRCNYIPVTNRTPHVGEKVFAIGSPLGYENTFSSGEISQLREDYIQISVPTDHGSSGGALINEYGEVIGITTAGVDKSKANLNFAKDISLLKDKLNLSY